MTPRDRIIGDAILTYLVLTVLVAVACCVAGLAGVWR